MPRRLWTEIEFSDWMACCGLSSKQAAHVLGVSDITVIRIRNGHSYVKDALALKAKAHRARSFSTDGSDGELLDSTAATSEIAGLTSHFGNAVVTGITSAILRGWTSANLAQFRQLRQPERMPAPSEWNGLSLEWLPTPPIDLVHEVEYRIDQNLGSYRIASIERTLVDLVVLRERGSLNKDDVMEAWTGAFRLADQEPEIPRISDLAARFGVAEPVGALLGVFGDASAAA